MTQEREQVQVTELVTPYQAEALANLIDTDVPTQTLPPLWHWVYLLERRPHRDLGPDGHPTSGIPTPPGPGRRRMFAGGRVTTFGELRLGEEATRTTRVVESREKQGSAGPLTFVTVRHEIAQGGEILIEDDNDIVYRAAGAGSLPATSAPVGVPEREARLDLVVDEALLFRFSALTYNAHRIHYDHNWVQQEGYDGLVVHGPLQALMMGELQRRAGSGLVGKTYAYRLVAPMVGPQTFGVLAGENGLAAGAEVRDARGVVTAVSTLVRPEPWPAMW
ncbi:MAG: mesaconyl-C4 CoA hydratase [Actinophytocola sp.]|nr:mesaconyl-C4 CoA hydratase [Actinophytocola sp.]